MQGAYFLRRPFFLQCFKSLEAWQALACFDSTYFPSSGIYALQALKHALIYCDYSDNGIPKKIYFKQKRLQWIAKFKVSTNHPLPLKIIANYNHHQRIMPLTLNEGTYPGEPDN